MTLGFGVLAAILLGLAFGWRWWTAAALGLGWYTGLAVQTAYLAHPDRTGFFHVNALRAVQGSHFAQYWISQPVILAACLATMWSASRARSRWLEPRPLPRSRRRGGPPADGVPG
jgi:hypothetical protein